MPTRILSLWLCTILCCSCWSGWLEASDARETPLVRAVKKARVAVVNIHTEKLAVEVSPGPPKKINGMGTGIVIDERGYIVTNQHVVADVESMSCTLHDGSTYKADVISYDRKHDLAVIKINPTKPLVTMPMGTSSDLMLGETVVAIGNAFGYTDTVTAGIVSSLSRDVEVNEHQSYKNLIQTDASINPGNSGGPLINLDGEVVGINVAIRAGAQRIGFTIPIDDARRYVARLLNIERLNNTYHGMTCHDEKRPGEFKLIVDSTDGNSPAAQAGLQSGDIITSIGSLKVADGADLERSLLGRKVGETVPVVVLRGGQTVTLNMSVQPLPSSVARQPKPAPVVSRAQNDESADELAWRVLGLKITRIAPEQFEPAQSIYHGGLRVVDVRAQSPAARNGIQQGDILVGLHDLETTKAEDIKYILNNAQVGSADQLKFRVLRGQQTLNGNLRLATKFR